MIQDLNIRTLLTGDVNRIRYVTRYSTSLVIHRENVAEHSYYVTQYAMFICQWVRTNDPNPVAMTNDVELQVLRRCIIHDLDESRTGDFQRPFKYRRPEMKALMDEAAREEFQQAIGQIFPEDRKYVDNLTREWEDAKDGTTAGAIVAFADYLSVISHLYAEVSCANLSVMQHYQSLMEYTAKFDVPRYEFIRPLVLQTQEIFSEMMRTAKERLPEIR